MNNMGWKQAALGFGFMLVGFAILMFDIDKWNEAWEAVKDSDARTDEAWRERERKTYETFMKHAHPGRYSAATKDPLFETPIASELGKSIHKGERWGTSQEDK